MDLFLSGSAESGPQKTKEIIAPYRKFRLVENGLEKVCFVQDKNSVNKRAFSSRAFILAAFKYKGPVKLIEWVK